MIKSLAAVAFGVVLAVELVGCAVEDGEDEVVGSVTQGLTDCSDRDQFKTAKARKECRDGREASAKAKNRTQPSRNGDHCSDYGLSVNKNRKKSEIAKEGVCIAGYKYVCYEDHGQQVLGRVDANGCGRDAQSCNDSVADAIWTVDGVQMRCVDGTAKPITD